MSFTTRCLSLASAVCACGMFSTELAAQPPPSKVLVVNTQDASVSVVDLATMKEVEKHKVGSRPYGIAVSNDGKTVAVGVEDEEKVKFFTLPDFKPKGEVKIGKMFNDHIVLTKDGKHILVANFYSDDVVGTHDQGALRGSDVSGVCLTMDCHRRRYGCFTAGDLQRVKATPASGVERDDGLAHQHAGQQPKERCGGVHRAASGE